MNIRRVILVLLAGISTNALIYFLATGAVTDNFYVTLLIYLINTIAAVALGEVLVLFREAGIVDGRRLIPSAAAISIAAAVISTFRLNYVFGLPVALALTSLTLPHAPLEIAGVFLVSLGYVTRKMWIILPGATLLALAAYTEIYVSVGIAEKILQVQMT